jgi:hypothetical protein
VEQIGAGHFHHEKRRRQPSIIFPLARKQRRLDQSAYAGFHDASRAIAADALRTEATRHAMLEEQRRRRESPPRQQHHDQSLRRKIYRWKSIQSVLSSSRRRAERRRIAYLSGMAGFIFVATARSLTKLNTAIPRKELRRDAT